MSENFALKSTAESPAVAQRVSSFTYKKRQRQLNASFQQQTDRTQTDRQQTDRQQTDRIKNDQPEDGNKFPPPDDNDLLQLEKKLNETNFALPEMSEYEEYFDYIEGAGNQKNIIPNICNTVCVHSTQWNVSHSLAPH